MTSIKLKVAETFASDVGNRIVRIGSSFMKEIGLKIGDVVKLEGKKETLVTVDKGWTGDLGMDIIRMDKVTRDNIGLKIDEYVEIRKADFKEAEQFHKTKPDDATKKARESAIKNQSTNMENYYKEAWKGASEEDLPTELKTKLKELNIPKGIVGQKKSGRIIVFPPNLKNYEEIVSKLKSIGLLREGCSYDVAKSDFQYEINKEDETLKKKEGLYTFVGKSGHTHTIRTTGQSIYDGLKAYLNIIEDLRDLEIEKKDKKLKKKDG